jgi:hypothetical protein
MRNHVLLLRLPKLPVLRLPAPSRVPSPRQLQVVRCNSKTKRDCNAAPKWRKTAIRAAPTPAQ